MKKIELLSPAGDMEKLRFAVEYGADAVYLSGKTYGMRAGSGNFEPDALRGAVEYCHARGVRAYVTVNTMPRCDELDALPEYLRYLQQISADAVIVGDLGVLALARKHAPRVDVHVSTQASVVNYESTRVFYELGASRIVLARELTLQEIALIREKSPPSLELECFVHGSMCVSYSGRCLLSNYMTGRDANRGACAQPCRWNYALVEEKRPGQYMPVFEGERGTYILSSKDMCMIKHLPELIDAGAISLKIEGRAKTFYYAATVTNAYRRALDLALKNPNDYSPPSELLSEVHKVSHREYFTGLYLGETDTIWHEGSEYIRDWDVCAVVQSCEADGQAILLQKNKFSPGDELELLMPGREALAFSLDEMRDAHGARIESAPHPHMTVRAKLPVQAPEMAIIRKRN